LQKTKESTARIVNWKEFKIDHCFTLEMSFCSSNYGRYEFLHYNKQLFYEIAYNIGQSLHNLAFPDNLNFLKVIEDIELRKKQGSFDKFSNNQVDDSDEDEMKER